MPGLSYNVNYFEVYGGKVFDLLNKRNRLTLREDAKAKIQVVDMSEKEVTNPSGLSKAIAEGNKLRSTSSTIANDTSSRSHAVCKIAIVQNHKNVIGSLLLIDLAVTFTYTNK